MRVCKTISINFQRRLRPSEEVDFYATLKQGKEKIGNTGQSSLIIPSASLPQKTVTGVGNLLDEEALKFFDFAKQYWGINYVQLLPEGQYRYHNNIYLPYSGSAFDLGSQVINFDLLTQKEYGRLLNESELQTIFNKKFERVAFENVIPKDSSGQKLLRKAYQELCKADTPEKKNLLEEIKNYSLKNKEWMEPKSIYEALAEKYQTRDVKLWNEVDKNLYNTDVVSLEKRITLINDIKNSELNKEIHFYEFKQFMAEKHLAKARSELNKKGLKLGGDMLVGFSVDEVWANPKAFVKNNSIGWGIPAINFETKEGEKIIRNKVNQFAKRYDGIRVDASWTYASQPLINGLTNEESIKEYSSKILDIIDDEIRKVKGENFNFENVTHDFLADEKYFNLFEGENVKSYCKNRIKIIDTNNLGKDWGTNSAFQKRGWGSSYILGVSTHDSQPLYMEYQNVAKRNQQIEILADILKIPKEKINSYAEYSQIKLAESLKNKHSMVFFTDALNVLECYKDNTNRVDDYRLKISSNYQEKYFSALEKGEGLNIMDALEKAFVSEGLDKKEPDLFEKIVKYRKILQTSEKKTLNKRLKLIIMPCIAITLGLIGLLLKNKKRAENSALIDKNT